MASEREEGRQTDRNDRDRPITKRERIEVRVNPEQKALVQHAADLQGRTLTDFVISSVQRAAEEAIRAHEVLTLSARESREFVEAVLNPPQPTAGQRAAADWYKREYLEQ